MKLNAAILALMGMALATAGRADVVGSDPTVNLGTLDTCSGCLFAYIDFSAANANQQVVSYSFFAGTETPVSNQITPLLFENTGGTNFQIIGIGATASGITAGQENTFSFAPLQGVGGTATIADSNTWFGWLDGSLTSANTGTITSNYPAGPGPGNYFAWAQPFILGDTITFDTFSPGQGQNTRTYSVDVTTTPEPGLYGALLLGLSGMALALVLRRRKA